MRKIHKLGDIYIVGGTLIAQTLSEAEELAKLNWIKWNWRLLTK